MRARIQEVAEEHFRRIGHHKTSVADIASELGMSRANVYRFFPSRDAIKESICRRLERYRRARPHDRTQEHAALG
ncbi:helix-turn-helix domain-containing protein (plasmid) [Sinorhizobium meliloti]|nr:helix-turn-helix domain-containing protein [Sinorhizobium meliloti]MDE4579284.1 TetR/AcrR family transcriptional regulator [Sinorhizobium meliloti]